MSCGGIDYSGFCCEVILMERFERKKDLLLMSYLRNNSRENLTRISRMTSIPVSTIFDRIHEFERCLVKKHTTLLDFKKIGFDVKLDILVKLPKEKRDEFQDFLMKNYNVNSLFRINNGYDFLIEAIFRDMSEANKFSEDLDRFSVQDKQELFVLEDIKREGFLSEAFHADVLFVKAG